MISIHLNTSLFESNFSTSISKKISADKRLIIVYDLYNCLPELNVSINKLDDIIDIYLLESILYLGKYHKNYFESERELPSYGIKKYLNDLFREQSQFDEFQKHIKSDHFFTKIIEYAQTLKKSAIQSNVWEHYISVELPFSFCLFELTQNGITLDYTKIEMIKNELRTARQKLDRALEINNVGGNELSDLNEWVEGYGFWEYLPIGRNEISIKDLSLLEDQHQVFKIYLRYEKLKRIESLAKKLSDYETVRPEYNVLGAVTGRCTSKNPNIMGIPKIFRPIIIPSRDDFGIVECDYSQMEVGIAAALARDDRLISDFNKGDVYEFVGNWLFSKEKDISRDKAKTIFLGIQYGLSKNTIAKILNVSSQEIKKILNILYKRYEKLQLYLNKLEILGLQNGYVESVSGLKRYRFDSELKPSYWENNWFKNFPIQSSASSVFKRSIIEIHKKLKNTSFNLLVPLYDSVVFEAPINSLHETTEIVKACMIKSMQEYFPALKPRISVNKSNPRCWNVEGKALTIEKFLKNPLYDIDIKDKRSSNVDWSKYC